MGDYKVPGVYVEEPFGLSLSVQTGETAVPVFAHDGALTKWKSAIKADEVVGFDSWLNVTSALATKRKSLVDAAVKEHENDQDKGKAAGETAGATFDTALDTDNLYQSLKLYFMNGGGHCYVAPVGSLKDLVPALDDVTLLVQAGSGRGFSTQVSTLCEVGKPYFAIFDGPSEELKTDTVPTKTQQDYLDTEFAAVYYPWLNVEIVSADDPTKTTKQKVPPSGAVAGVYARVDRERGVWKAPANVEIVGATPEFKVSDAVDALCNAPTSGGRSINVIRAFRGTGPLIWGARTLQSNLDTWKYVPVRRLFNAVEKDIKTAMSMALFEPNSAPTWERVRGAIDSYLHGLWRDGALQGDTPEKAYYVQIGLGVTMTPDDLTSGNMIVKVGLAAVRPAEFIVLQLTQNVVSA
ncbi:phage tail sheath family protein [Burkholderia stagnalis]|uniref:phage tail sheath family protein n=1 Tax=Burkholderia stagnalis TaxID=1503054 RepID=UPI00075F1358|nr:phage tail sheath C-terminal domain-containing protein [Burkholderia stagnalis]KWI28409.1 phage tail protein [Burkholderia stagnalis]KWI70996.1 phage tail protein [Burkholderia stagnalis]MDY7806679.1 phage tail sheath C-terminal domain-containing protein [Burkholderia stagnalis]